MGARMDSKGLSRKMKSLGQVAELLVNAPRDLAIFASAELVSEELNFNPIRRISGNLARSFSFRQLDAATWAVMQTQQIAPYAQEVAQRTAVRFGYNYVQLANNRTLAACERAVTEEFALALDRINAGRPYTYRPLQPIL